MNFRKIYDECNLQTESIKSFKEILFECNVRPLFEQILREAMEEENKEEVDKVKLKKAIETYEDNIPNIDQSGNIINSDDKVGKNVDITIGNTYKPIPKTFEEILNDEIRRNSK